MRIVALILGLLLSLCAACAEAVPGQRRAYQVEGITIPVPVVQVEHRTETGDSGRIDDYFTFATERGEAQAKYSRYEREGQAALTNADMGLGLPGGGTAWYGNNTLRLLLDGEDLTARLPATSVEVAESPGLGQVRMIWRTDDLLVSLIFSYASDPVVCYVQGSVELLGVITEERALPELQVQLTAFPGALTGYLKLPYHRWVLGPGGAEVEVAPPVQEQSLTCDLQGKEPWLFFADRYQDAEIRPSRWCYGPCALVVLPEERPRAEVRVTSYPVNTVLTYPPQTRQFHFALLTFDHLGNELSLHILKETLPQELKRLRSLPQTFTVTSQSEAVPP